MIEPAWVAVGLVVVTAFHGSAGGIRSAAGRDGLLAHRRTEAMGAVRGVGAVGLLTLPWVLMGIIDTVLRPERANIYHDLGIALLTVFAPVVALAGAAWLVAISAPWQWRAFANTVVLAGLEFVRPAFAVVALALVWVVTEDPLATAVASGSVASALQVTRVVSRWLTKGEAARAGH